MLKKSLKPDAIEKHSFTIRISEDVGADSLAEYTAQ